MAKGGYGGVIRRQVRRAGAALKKRYFKGKGYMSPNIGNVVKDVAKIKALINVEKKRILQTSSSIVGQCSVNTDGGWYALTITPTPPEDNTFSGRSGQSIKATSMYATLQFADQANCNQPVKLRWFIIKTMGVPYNNPTTAVQTWFNSNPYLQAANGVVIRDFQAPFDPTQRGNFRVLRSGIINHKADSYSGQKIITTKVIKHRFNRGKGHHVRYQGNGNTPTSGELVLVIMADCGNVGATASTLVGVNTTGALTGLTMQYSSTTYYVDN